LVNGTSDPKTKRKSTLIANEINIAKLLQRDPLEVKIFAREATQWIYNVILSYVQNKEDAEEVTQDTLLAALSALKSFRSEAALRTWVYSIAINKSKDFLKYKTRKKRFAKIISLSKKEDEPSAPIEPVNFVHPGVELESKEQMEVLFTGINQLPEKQKTALILAKLEQMSQKEIAEIMDVTPKAVESLLSRAKANLKQYLETEGIKMYQQKKQKKIQ